MSQQEFESIINEAIRKSKIYILSKFNIQYMDLDDVIQNASIKAFKSISSFKSKSSFQTWFNTICFNETLNFIKKRNTLDKYTNRYSNIIDKDSSSEETRNKIEEYSELVKKSLQSLNYKQREIIELIINNSKSPKEISDILNIPRNLVNTRIFCAKKKLKKIMGDKSLVH